ncbi:MAG: thiolase family protein [Rhodobacterales bacterium]|nr:thiolase family protein [Rhodobacterales bacterium]MDX5501269.1 thiolase family protein [Rhodobacterales bacterium]
MTGLAPRDVVIVAAARTPVGRYRGTLASVRADHLGAHVLNALLARTGLSAGDVEDVVMGCVTQVGEQCGNVARTSLLSAGWPETVPGVTIDRKCGSGEAAVHLAAAMIASGARDIMVAGGVENMTRVRMGGNREIYGDPFGHLIKARFDLTSQGEAAERISDFWGFSRADLDTFALESQRRAAAAQDAGAFVEEIAPICPDDWAEPDTPPTGTLFAADETIRRDTSAERLASLKPSFRPDGRVTAGNASQISDGAAALLLMSADRARSLGLTPRARIRSHLTVGSDPALMLTGPVEATRQALARAGLHTDDVALYEVNEAFAPVPLMWMRDIGVGPERLNVNGGAIALGHPLGASGARIMTSLLHTMERQDVQFGLQAICCAGGLGTATVLERI